MENISLVVVQNQEGKQVGLKVNNTCGGLLVDIGRGLVPLREVEEWLWVTYGEKWRVVALQGDLFRDKVTLGKEYQKDWRW